MTGRARVTDEDIERAGILPFVDAVLNRLADGRLSRSQAANTLANAMVAAYRGNASELLKWTKIPDLLPMLAKLDGASS